MGQGREMDADGSSSGAGAGCTYHELEAKSITRIPGIADPWFLARYGMNLYRGCEHGCLYCDGRAERYYVQGDFARDIRVKKNAVELLTNELRRVREPGFVFLGGGVCDAYQPAEAHYKLARGALEQALQNRLPVHILTKSSLVERDFDLLQAIQTETGAILSFSIQTLDDEVRKRFEPLASPIERRWEVLAKAKHLGLATGVMAMPVLPGISDQAEAIDRLVAKARSVEVDFVCFGGLTLRPGTQQETYLKVIQEHYPEHIEGYQRVYRDGARSGAGDGRYYERIQRCFFDAIDRDGLFGRVPRRLF